MFQDDKSIGGGASEGRGDDTPVILTKFNYFACSGCGFVGNNRDGFKEEGDPGLPVAPVTDGLQNAVVILAVLTKVMGKIEDGFVQRSLFTEQEGYQQAAYSPVAVEKRVNRLELGVRQTGSKRHS